jgi:XTP/dITP diphosphohydrolase
MHGVEDRSAHFTCAAVYVDDGVELVELGVWPGTLLTEPAGAGGFGYDPIFRPDGSETSAAQLTADEKNAVSHRAIAFAHLFDLITAL